MFGDLRNNGGGGIYWLTPEIESDPNELLLCAHALLANYIARGPHCRAESTLHCGQPRSKSRR